MNWNPDLSSDFFRVQKEHEFNDIYINQFDMNWNAYLSLDFFWVQNEISLNTIWYELKSLCILGFLLDEKMKLDPYK